MNFNILIVDDEPKIREIISAYLKSSGYTVFEASCGEEALKILNNKKIHLAVLDLMLPDIMGEDICKKIRSFSSLPIIMVTSKTSEDDILNCLSLGGDDYIVKPFSPKQLVARVDALIRRSYDYKASNLLSFNNNSLIINLEAFEVLKDNSPVSLTPIEFKLLCTFAQNTKRTFTRNELLDIILGNDCDSYDRVIDSHIKNLRIKLRDKENPNPYILTVHGIGYKFGGFNDKQVK